MIIIIIIIKSILLTKAEFIWPKLQCNCEILLQLKITLTILKFHLFIMIKAEFSASILQYSVSHDLMIIINVESCAA